MKVTNMMVCHDHLNDDRIHHPVDNKVLEVKRL